MEKVVENYPAAYDIMAAGCDKDDIVLSEKEKTRTACNHPNVPMFIFNSIKKGESFLHLVPNGYKQTKEVASNEEKVAIPDSQHLPGQDKAFPCSIAQNTSSQRVGEQIMKTLTPNKKLRRSKLNKTHATNSTRTRSSSCLGLAV